MPDVEKIAQGANMIVNGYALTVMGNGWVRVINLNAPDSALVLSEAGDVLETSTDDIEAQIVRGYYFENKEFMGGCDA